MKYLLKNKLTFIILAGCLILAFELLVLGSSFIEQKPSVEKPIIVEPKPVKILHGPDWDDLEYAGGSHKAIYYSGRKNFKTVDGTYQPIDTNIAASDDKTMQDLGYVYSMTKNDFHIYFKKNSNDSEAVRFQVGDSWVAYTYSGAQASEATYTGNTLTYPSIYPGIDLRYTITNDTLLEELVVKDKESVKEVEQKLSLGGVTFKKTEEGSLEFTKTGEKTVLWSFPAPIMYEEKDNTKASEQLSYVVTHRAGEVYLTRKIESAGQDWLAKASFPVVLDATAAYLPGNPAEDLAYARTQSGSATQISPWDYTDATGTVFNSTDYTNVQSDNSVYKNSATNSNLSTWALIQHNFRFKIAPSADTISQISVTYGGYRTNLGNNVTAKAQLKTDIGDSDIVASLATSDIPNSTVTLPITTNNDDGSTNTADDASYYLDASGYLFIRSYYSLQSTSSLLAHILYTDYVQVQVTYMTPPSNPAYYAPNSDYEIGMSWADASTDETGWLVQRSLTGAVGSWSDIGYVVSGGSATANCSGGILNSYSYGLGYVSFYNECLDMTHRLSVNTKYYYRVRTVNTTPEPDHYSPYVYFTGFTTKPYRYTNADRTTLTPTLNTLSASRIQLCWAANCLSSTSPYPATNPSYTRYVYKVVESDTTTYYFDAAWFGCTTNPPSVLLNTTFTTRLGGVCPPSTNWGNGPFEAEAYSGTGKRLPPNTKYTFSLCSLNGELADDDNQQFCGNSLNRWTWANAPTSMNYGAVSTNSIQIQWNDTITDPDNPPGTKYRIVRAPNDGVNDPSDWNPKNWTIICNGCVTKQAGVTSYSYTDSNGLAENGKYFYRVAALNYEGVLNWAPEPSPKYRYTLLTAPTMTKADRPASVDPTQLVLEVAPPAKNPSAAAVQFRRYTTSNCPVTETPVLLSRPANGIYTQNDTNRSPNTQYWYQAIYYNGDNQPSPTPPGWGPCKTSQYTYASSPASVSPCHDQSVQTADTMKWSWGTGSPANPNITEYFAQDNDSPVNSTIGYTGDPDGWIQNLTSWQVNNKYTPNQGVTVSARARNAEGVMTSFVNVCTAYTSADVPTNVAISFPDPESSGKLKITWDGNGTNYRLQESVDNNVSDPWADVVGYNGSDKYYTDSDLGANTKHYYRVLAKNGNGDETDWSYPSPAFKYTRANVPNAPKLTKIESQPNQINVRIKEDDDNPHGGVLPDTKYAVCAVYKVCSLDNNKVCKIDSDCNPLTEGYCTQEQQKYVKYDVINSIWTIDKSGDTCSQDGTKGDWHTWAPSPPSEPGWGGSSGVVVQNIDAGKYTFKAIARNEDYEPTKFGPLATLLLVKNNLVGWAWSSNVGWISMNCLNFYANPQNYFSCGQADNWGVNTYFESGRDINPLDGYAWSGTGSALGYSWQPPMNVSQSTRASYGDDPDYTIPSIAVDSNGYPHMAWSERQAANSFDIYYIQWNGSKWVKADLNDYVPGTSDIVLNVSNTPGTFSIKPSLAIDSNGNANIAFEEGSSVWVLRWDSTDGRWETVDGTPRASAIGDPTGSGLLVGYEYGPSLAVDSSGNPHVAYQNGDAGNWEIYYRRWDPDTDSGNGAWVTVSGDTGNTNINVSNTAVDSTMPRLAVGSDKQPRIVWHEPGGVYGQIYYRWWNGSNWVTISGQTDNTNVKVNVNMPALKDGVEQGDFEGKNPSLALYADNTPGIVWRDPCTVVYRKWNGTNWVSVSGSTSITDLRLNPEWWDCADGRPDVDIYNEQPYIAFSHHGDDPAEIYFRHWNGSNWVDMDGTSDGADVGNVSQSLATVSNAPAIAVDSSGRVHITWWEKTFKDVTCTDFSNPACWCKSDSDCPADFSQCTYKTDGPRHCLNNWSQSCTVDSECPAPYADMCTTSYSKCTAFDTYYTGWLPSAQPSGLGWISFNPKVCSNEKQRGCQYNSDCKTGGTCGVSTGDPPGVCSNNNTINCTADGECGSGNYCIKGYGYCMNKNLLLVDPSDDYKYGTCSDDESKKCKETDLSLCITPSTARCILKTCVKDSQCPDLYNPGDEYCKITSTASASGLTRQIEGYARVLSQKDAGVAQGQPDWGWIKLAGQYGGPGMDADTAGLWHFNEGGTATTTDDTSFNNHDGTINNATWITGKIGKGLDFNGSNATVTATNVPDLGNEFTIEAWVKPDDVSDARGIISKANYTGVIQGWMLRLWNGGKAEFVIGDGNTGEEGAYYDTALKTGQWYYIVGVKTQSSFTIYVNGIKGEIKNFTKFANSIEPLKVGYVPVNTPNYWDGIIDEVRVTNRALTDQEVSDEYTSGPYLLSLLEVNSQAFFADPDVNANDVKLYSAFGFSWSSRTSPGFGWVEFMPAGAIIGIPWLQTLYGDIFANQSIQLAPPPRGSGQYTSTYLIQANGSIVGVPGYYMSTSTGPPTSKNYPISQAPSGTYQYQPIPGVTDVLSRIDISGLTTIVSNGKNKYGFPVQIKTAADLNSLLFADPVLGQTIYYVDGDVNLDETENITFKNGTGGQNGSGLIVINGDLTINKDIVYDPGSVTNTKQLASVAWIVKGNIYINPIVRKLAGVFVAVGKDTTEGNGMISTARLVGYDGITPSLDSDATAWDGGSPGADLYGNFVEFNKVNDNRAFLRFGPIDVKPRSTIKKAVIKVRAKENSSDQFIAKMGLLDGNDILEFDTNTYNTYLDTYKKKEISYNIGSWAVDQWYTYDVTDLVQYYVDREDYVQGNHLGLRIRVDGSAAAGIDKKFYSVDVGNANAPQLFIEYSPWTVEYQITDGKNDAVASSSAWDKNAACMQFGWTTAPQRSFLRYGPITLPKDSEIKEAHVVLDASNCNIQSASFQSRQALLNYDNMPELGCYKTDPAQVCDPSSPNCTCNPYSTNTAGSEVTYDISNQAWIDGAPKELTDVKNLIQDWIGLAGYTPGNYLGIRIRRDTNETVAGANQSRGFYSATGVKGAKLSVEYRSRLDVAGLMAGRGYNFDREYVKGLEPAEKIVYDGRVMVNTPPGLGDFSKLLPVYQQVIP